MSEDASSRGLLLFAHGARDTAWAAPFEAVLARVRTQRPDAQVTLAFLELMSPDLATAAAQLVRRGCQRVDVVPLFLGTGGHVRRDVPLLVQRAPAAIVVLVALCVPAFLFGAWLAVDGDPSTGIVYMATAAIYIACLGPSCRQWLLRTKNEGRRTKN